MTKPAAIPDEVKPNTGAHEHLLSEAAKGMVAGLLDMCAISLNASISKVGSEDPLSAERYIHLADTLSLIAVRLYEVGERSRLNAQHFYLEAKER